MSCRNLPAQSVQIFDHLFFCRPSELRRYATSIRSLWICPICGDTTDHKATFRRHIHVCCPEVWHRPERARKRAFKCIEKPIYQPEWQILHMMVPWISPRFASEDQGPIYFSKFFATMQFRSWEKKGDRSRAIQEMYE